MRFFSTILFSLMVMVLPMAGVQQYFCTMSMSFVSGSCDCSLEEETDCCGKQGKQNPTAPDCMVSTKLLPNAEKSSPVQIPVAVAWSMVPVSTFDLFPVLLWEAVSTEKDRGPPDFPRLYSLQCRMLI